MPALPEQITNRILALLANGTPQNEIKAIIYKVFRTDITQAGISKIGKRYKNIISEYKLTLQKHDKATADTLLATTHKLLSKTLDNVDNSFMVLDELKKDYMLGNLTNEEYIKKINQIKLPNANELVSVSKEMYNQSRTDKSLPTTYIENRLSKDDLKELAENSDTIRMTEVLFNKNKRIQAIVTEPTEQISQKPNDNE